MIRYKVNVKRYLAKLKVAGIIEGNRKGLEICYSVVDEEIKEIVKILTK